MEFWDRITQSIKASGMSQFQLAEDCGIPLATFNKWKKGKVYPRADVVLKMSEILDLSLEYLLTGKEADDPAVEIIIKSPAIRDLVELLGEYPEHATILKAYLEGKIDSN